MRIALTHRYAWPEVRRGAERMVPALASALAGRGHEVTVFTASWERGFRDDGAFRTVRIRQRREDPFQHEADFARRVLPHLAVGRFEAVHSFGARDAWASIVAARLHRGRRTVYTNLGVALESWLRYRPERRAHEAVVRSIDYYGCMSRWALQVLRDDFQRDGVLTPGGVDFGEFKPAERRAEEPVILFSGAVTEPRKGVATLLEALPTVAEAEPGVRVWLSGPGDPAELLASAPPAARERTEVLGVGEAERQAERYGQAWVTTLPSTYDSFGMALLESLACGTPIVATTHGAPSELVSPDTGAVCAPNDADSLAAACVYAISLARRETTVAACRESARPYEWKEGLAPRFERFYDGSAAKGLDAEERQPFN